jgi:hypothetical protein
MHKSKKEKIEGLEHHKQIIREKELRKKEKKQALLLSGLKR